MHSKLRILLIPAFIFGTGGVVAEEGGWGAGEQQEEHFQQEEQHIQREGIPQMSELDAAGDGYVTREEAQSNDTVTQYFNWADVDGDGKLSAEEYGRLERLFEQDDELAE